MVFFVHIRIVSCSFICAYIGQSVILHLVWIKMQQLIKIYIDNLNTEKKCLRIMTSFGVK